jgi:hypothetical protein
MGLFSPYVYKRKDGTKFYLHMKIRRGVTLYYFSKEAKDALYTLPPGHQVVENPRTGMPYLKTVQGGGFSLKKKKGEENV